MNKKIFFLIIILIILLIYNYIIDYFNKRKLDNKFYNYKKIFPELQELKDNYDIIYKEYKNLPNKWIDWPEKNLYKYNKKWDTFPLKVFNKWYHKNFGRQSYLYQSNWLIAVCCY